MQSIKKHHKRPPNVKRNKSSKFKRMNKRGTQGPAHKPNSGIEDCVPKQMVSLPSFRVFFSRPPLLVPSLVSLSNPTSSASSIYPSHPLCSVEEQRQSMAQEEKWAAFGDEEEEALSLSDLPLTFDDKKRSSPRKEESNESFEFEFLSSGLQLKASELDMCAADEVFYQGQILPFRPSVSSDSGLMLRSRCALRCDSMDRNSSALSSLVGSVRSSSVSSRSSSGCVSRSHSLGSMSSDAPRQSVSNKFYAHPSPSPQLRSSTSGNSARKSTSSPGPAWSLFRLGVVKAPEIELRDLRSRLASSGTRRHRRHEPKPDKVVVKANDGKCGAKHGKISDGCKRRNKLGERASRFLGLGCRYSPEAGDTVPPTVSIAKKKKEGEVGLKRGQSMRSNRISEWLEDLSIARTPMA